MPSPLSCCRTPATGWADSYGERAPLPGCSRIAIMEKAASVRRQTDGEAGKVMPIIDRTYPLGQAREAMRYLEEDHARRKLVIRRSSSQYEARTRLRLPVVSSLRLDQKTTTDPGIRGYRMRPYRPRRVNGGDLCVARRASRVARRACSHACRNPNRLSPRDWATDPSACPSSPPRPADLSAREPQTCLRRGY